MCVFIRKDFFLENVHRSNTKNERKFSIKWVLEKSVGKIVFLAKSFDYHHHYSCADICKITTLSYNIEMCLKESWTSNMKCVGSK